MTDTYAAARAACSPEPNAIENLRRDFITKLCKFKNDPSLPPFDDLDIEDAADDFIEMIENCDSPADWYGYMGHGAYKECYSLSKNYVIKFITEQNDTNAEKMIVRLAEHEGLGHIFMPSLFGSLHGYALPATEIDVEEREGAEYPKYNTNHSQYYWKTPDSYYGTYFVAYVIQPKIKYTDEDSPYGDAKLINKELLTVVLPSTWRNKCIEMYGIETAETLDQFFKEYQISDLHYGNVGYMEGKNGEDVPVIIDWISNCNR